MKGKSVVVTGGAGFIGSNLVEELARDNTVTIIDDLSTGKAENVASLGGKGNVRFIRGGVTDLSLLLAGFRGADYVFHQAAIPSVPRSIEDPLASHEVNITGTLNVLIAARDKGVKKVVFASSSSVYGDTPVLPKREDMPPCPLSPYAVTKLAAEHYCTVFRQIYGLPTVCLRYFNIYGPRQDPNSQYAAVIPRFIRSILSNEPPLIFGDGEQTRDFTFVRDAVHANILAAESQAVGVFNVGGGQRVSINHLARAIMTIVGFNPEPVYREARAGDIKHSLADITLARGFGYEPRYSLEEGLKETARVVVSASPGR